MHHVIVGAGPAGVTAAETLRKLDAQARITMVGDEPEPPYSRMAIPYLLVEDIDEAGTYLRKGTNHFERARIEVVRDRAVSVDPARKSLALQDGGALAYDKLLIATGSRPVAPPVPGIDLPGVVNCWTLEDARRIVDGARPGSQVVLIGAGFIGCIILESLVGRGVKLTVVEMGDRMVPRMMNRTAGGLIKRWCENKGLRVLTSARVGSIEQSPGGGLEVAVADGPTLEADLVISAAGVRPNVGFLQGSGIRVEQGVLVDEYLCSSVADVYAAGDVAQGRDFSTGEYSVQAIQPTAVEHGRIAASNMAGHEQAYPGTVNMNVLATLGLVSTSFGLWDGVEGGDTVELCDEEKFKYLSLQFKGDLLVGASSLGLTEHVGVLRGLIQTQVHLKGWKETLRKDPTRLMEAYLACVSPLGYNARVA